MEAAEINNNGISFIRKLGSRGSNLTNKILYIYNSRNEKITHRLARMRGEGAWGTFKVFTP